MTLLRRRDQKVLDAAVVRQDGEASLPILVIEGEPFSPDETAGYYVLAASDVERAELQRGGYVLQARPRASDNHPFD
jgi:hypothetical protein